MQVTERLDLKIAHRKRDTSDYKWLRGDKFHEEHGKLSRIAENNIRTAAKELGLSATDITYRHAGWHSDFVGMFVVHMPADHADLMLKKIVSLYESSDYEVIYSKVYDKI